MKKLCLVVFSMIAIALKTDVYADCSIEKLSSLKVRASNIGYTYYPTYNNDNASFNMVISNTSDFYIDTIDKLVSNNIINDMYTTKEYGEIRLYNLTPGEKYTFYVYSLDDDCYERNIGTKTITLPTYNNFYGDPVCNGKEEYSLCTRWWNGKLTYEQFVENVNKYNLQIESDIIEEIEEPEIGLFDIMLNIYVRYYWIILPTIIIGLSSVIVYKNKKEKLF